MNERKAQETIRDAVRDSLAWLDGLPSAENEILEKTEKEERILMTAISPAARKPGSRRWKPVLAFCAAAVLFAGVWAAFRNGSLFNRILSFIGSISLEIYLLFEVFLRLFRETPLARLPFEYHGWVYSLIILCITIAAAYAVHRIAALAVKKR